uniref:Uncharacterized protein n=1 Tax=Arundo donax TaxID=35708 RepID=A0A0A9B2B9_ARUDO
MSFDFSSLVSTKEERKKTPLKHKNYPDSSCKSIARQHQKDFTRHLPLTDFFT